MKHRIQTKKTENKKISSCFNDLEKLTACKLTEMRGLYSLLQKATTRRLDSYAKRNELVESLNRFSPAAHQMIERVATTPTDEWRTFLAPIDTALPIKSDCRPLATRDGGSG